MKTAIILLLVGMAALLSANQVPGSRYAQEGLEYYQRGNTTGPSVNSSATLHGRSRIPLLAGRLHCRCGYRQRDAWFDKFLIPR